MGKDRKVCVVCAKRIHPERLAAMPIAVTCSRACSQERLAAHRRENSRKYRQRKKLAKAAEKAAAGESARTGG